MMRLTCERAGVCDGQDIMVSYEWLYMYVPYSANFCGFCGRAVDLLSERWLPTPPPPLKKPSVLVRVWVFTH